MSCHHCTEHRATVLAAFAAGDPLADRRADSAARQARVQDPAPVHIHYDPWQDRFVVLRDTQYVQAA